MSKRIEIRNIKHIRNLEFKLPSPGVHVLTGSNGCGKTTLLACILRIRYHRSFQDNFKTSSDSRLDNFNSGYIKYIVNDRSVSYQHAGVRWPPHPRTNYSILSQFGYPEVRFLPATGNRLYIHDSELNPSDFRPVSQWIKDDLNRLLETSKFGNLRYVQTGSQRGPGSGSQRWKRAYVIKIGGTNNTTYYSEKNFSLGEILILNTLLLIGDVPDQSMLLIDELEMALHPRVQVRLLRYLEEKAAEKRLTILISTHSSSLIKCAKSLIYLENPSDDLGNIKVHYGAYPAQILKEIAVEEDIQPDYVFAVEDEMAELLLRETVDYYFRLYPDRIRPVCKFLPIGGYPEVMRYSRNTFNYLHSSKIGQYAFLDADVFDTRNALDALGNGRTPAQQNEWELFNSLGERLKFLPITPELGIWRWLVGSVASIQIRLNTHFMDVTFNLADLVDSAANEFPDNADNPRDPAKKRLRKLVQELQTRTNEDSKRINRYLFGLYVEEYYCHQNEQNSLRGLLGPVFNTRGNRT
ncbi:MAG: AAA family ATPase [Imperialibacter sp.]|uniref:AAA family ATPase n=1 Tax=Imperialibacter sp. TaxID=2038411 RepID=UPI003A890BE8